MARFSVIAAASGIGQATVRDDGSRWGIEPLFSDCKSRGFQREETQLQAPDRLDRLWVIRALARYGCVRTGQEDSVHHPTPLEKTQEQPDSDPWTFRKLARSALSWFKHGLRLLLRNFKPNNPCRLSIAFLR